MAKSESKPTVTGASVIVVPRSTLCRRCKFLAQQRSILAAHCNRWTCEFCKNCERCGCSCRKCPICRRRVPGRSASWCGTRCNVCSACCRCRKMPHYGRVAPEVASAPLRLNTLPRTLGVELELSNWGKMKKERFQYLNYSPAHDWSVQPSGEEMVIHPLRGDGFLRGIIELGAKLHTTKAEANDTCAYHVHVGAQDLSYFELRRLLRVYASIEQEIYDYMILPHRRDVPRIVHYCQMLTRTHVRCERCERYDAQYPGHRHRLPLLSETLAVMNRARTTHEIKAEISKMLYFVGIPANAKEWHARSVAFPREGSAVPKFAELQTRKGGRYEWCRYVGLNLHAWMYRGTIEFRMKEGTTDVEELLNWPLWCGWLVQATQSMTESESLKPWALSKFSRRFMPEFLAEWVDRKIAEPKRTIEIVDRPQLELPPRRPAAGPRGEAANIVPRLGAITEEALRAIRANTMQQQANAFEPPQATTTHTVVANTIWNQHPINWAMNPVPVPTLRRTPTPDEEL